MGKLSPGTFVRHTITKAEGTLLSYNERYNMYYVMWDHGTATLILVDYVEVV